MPNFLKKQIIQDMTAADHSAASFSAGAQPSLSAYLPASMQLWEVWWAIGISMALVAFGRQLPKPWNALWLNFIYSFLGSLIFLAPILGVADWPYSFGTSLISSALANTFYVLGISWAEARIRSILGLPVAPPVNEAPITLSPGPNLNPSNPK